MARQGGTAEEEGTIRLRDGLMMKEREEGHESLPCTDDRQTIIEVETAIVCNCNCHYPCGSKRIICLLVREAAHVFCPLYVTTI